MGTTLPTTPDLQTIIAGRLKIIVGRLTVIVGHQTTTPHQDLVPHRTGVRVTATTTTLNSTTKTIPPSRSDKRTRPPPETRPLATPAPDLTLTPTTGTNLRVTRTITWGEMGRNKLRVQRPVGLVG